ncbi:hypothetical protein Daus18300_003500 [Diaporthe australafricana]|uniref:Uncharacterized protein n=1 Tax=Diaporthe australafricana TaxID=127596 RepID=A0ABR3XFM2_9PEZI
MSDTETGSERNQPAASTRGKKPLWDESKLENEVEKFNDWINISTTNVQRTFVPDDKYCGIWYESPNKERHASFGDGGTTASVGCLGDLMQMSQYLGVGHSGIFTADQRLTHEPYYVVDRAGDLDSLARNIGDKFSFSLLVPPDCSPDETKPPEIRWVNWRWPRYEYCLPINKNVKACFQYMVHDGLVLQQFTLENTSDKSVKVDPFEIESIVLIRDLDFLDGSSSFNNASENTKEYLNVLGPNGYGHVCVHTLPDLPNHKHDSTGRCTAHAVACVTTAFVNGSAVPFSSQGKLTSIFLKDLEPGNQDSDQNKVDIVIARKLILLPKGPTDWRNFVISAEDGNINHWLEEEIKSFWDEDESLMDCFARLSMTEPENTLTGAARDDTALQDASETVASIESDNNEPTSVEAEAHEDLRPSRSRFPFMPVGQSSSETDWNPKHHLEYFAWRHLEHILSVCAIPLSTPGLVEVDRSSKGKPPARASSPSVALTCGDMSGHRINTSASFFAFKFLIDVCRRLRLLQCKTKYIVEMENRIKVICTGHVRWLQLIRKDECNPRAKRIERPFWSDGSVTNEQVIHAGCFAANYWVTGKVMTQNSDTWQPPNRMTDTALHILKLADCKDMFPDFKDQGESIVQTIMDDIFVPWLTELDRLDIRSTCSWPHSMIEGVIRFRLDDHFWIWKALKALKAVATKVSLPSKKRKKIHMILGTHRTWLLRLHTGGPGTVRLTSIRDESASQAKDEKGAILTTQNLEDATRGFMQIVKRLSPNNFQRVVLQRFTTENNFLRPKRRMLAVTRSAIEMRFLLHARDTALFYDEDYDFFMSSSASMQLWINTLDAQCHHEENMDTDWDNSLRYALGITMGVRGRTLNLTSKAPELVKSSVNVLIGASGSDAFFPGQLDESGREPTIFADEKYRDHFYHSGFEINHVLFSRASKINSVFPKKESGSAVEPQCQDQGSAVHTPHSSHRQPDQAEVVNKAVENGAILNSGSRSTASAHDTQRNLTMNKFLPFTNAIPPNNVNNISDEWLYQYPEFLHGRRFGREEFYDACDLIQRVPSTTAKPSEARTSWLATTPDLGSKLHLSTLFDYFWTNEAHDYSHSSSNSTAESEHPRIVLHNVDTRKGKRKMEKRHHNAAELGEKSRKQIITTFEKLCEFLREPRTAQTAKKRILWMPSVDLATAFACCAFSSKREQHELSKFFERHSSYSKDVRDETSLSLNKWRTEIYLSFYLLAESNGPVETWRGSPHRDDKPIPFPGQTHLDIRRASMSFRFDGDFFDRFWTCHFIEYMPRSAIRRKDPEDSIFDERDWNSEKQWSQRKVLELDFLKRILGRINAESKAFTCKVRTVLRIDDSSLALAPLTWLKDFSKEHMQGSIKDSMELLLRFEKVLELVEEDLAVNLGTLCEKWDRREMNRGDAKPRWTPNDDKKHGAFIHRLCVDVERATGKLQANHDDIRNLKEFLAASRKNLRTDMEREGNEKDRLRDADIRYLTYVTVIFQPLGFAASFYSMGGAPEPALIVSLVEFSAAAFVVTLVLILGYRVLASPHDEDGVLQKFSNKSIRQYWRAKDFQKDKKSSLQLVAHLIRGTCEQIARYILEVVRWCWARIYKRHLGRVAFPIFKQVKNKKLSNEEGTV